MLSITITHETGRSQTVSVPEHFAPQVEALLASLDWLRVYNDGQSFGEAIGECKLATRIAGRLVDSLADVQRRATAMQRLPADDMTCGSCGRTWNSTLTPTPAARCPFEDECEH